MKIWERNDYAEIQAQVERYWASPEIAGATAVMLVDMPPPDFSAAYRQRSKDPSIPRQPTCAAPC